jgi:hypothetical protein
MLINFRVKSRGAEMPQPFSSGIAGGEPTKPEDFVKNFVDRRNTAWRPEHKRTLVGGCDQTPVIARLNANLKPRSAPKTQ